MKTSTDRILTTHVGSLVRPHPLLRLVQAKIAGEPYDRDALARETRQAVADIVRRQAESGIDIVSDGEQSKAGFFGYLSERLTGLDPEGLELADQLRLPAGTRFVRLLASNPPATALSVERMISARGARARLRVAARGLVPSPEYLRSVEPLARRGGWGLAVAYIWRPFHIAARLPRGLQAWLRVIRPSDHRRQR